MSPREMTPEQLLEEYDHSRTEAEHPGTRHRTAALWDAHLVLRAEILHRLRLALQPDTPSPLERP